MGKWQKMLWVVGCRLYSDRIKVIFSISGFINLQHTTHNLQHSSMSSNLNDFYTENKRLVSEYIETRLQLLKLTSVRSLARTLSMLILVTLFTFMVLFFLLFVVIAFSWWMSDKLGSAALGFLSGGGLFLLILLLAIVFRKPLFLNPLIRLFIQSSTAEEDDNDY